MDSLIKPKELFQRAKELGQSSIAITDHGTLAGAWDGLKYSKQVGVKLIFGCEFYFVDDVSDENSKIRHVILLAKNYQGYKNLLLANKLANDNHIILFKKVLPRIDWNVLERCSDGLICTTACGGGILSQLINTRQIDKAKAQAQRLKDIFGDSLALEIQPHAMRRNATQYNDYEDQTLVNHTLIKFGDELGIKVVAATDAHYLNKDGWEAHDALLAIGTRMPARAISRLKYTSHEFYLKSREEVVKFFARRYKDRAEEFCDNSLYFANMCEEPEWINPKYSNPSGNELPEFPVPDQRDYSIFLDWLSEQPEEVRKLREDSAYLRYWCLKEMPYKTPQDKRQEYLDRLDEEFEVIDYLGFSSYMLIVADYVQYCHKNDIPVGPGRGSAGGSLTTYLMGIHTADPIKYGLIFARFLNKFKGEYPDIDLDFASYGKELVQQYIRDKYGDDKVAHISNVNTMTPKVFARDIARAFEYGGNQKAAVEMGTAIADAIPADITTLDSALNKAPLFQEYANSLKYPELKKFAGDLGGIAKVWSTHAGGLVIGKRPLAECVPLRRDKDGTVALEYEKKRTEANGLVKMDILGVSTLDIIINTLQLIKLAGKTPPIKEIIDYDANDPKTYEMISRGDTFCIFQLGTSGGAIDLCKRIKPKCIEDLALINALLRPNAKSVRKPFIKARDSGEETELLHPYLKRAFESTYGFAVFEECLMYVAQDVAGWDMHEADRLRKLTKEKGKDPAKVRVWRKDFIEGAVNNKYVPRKTATQIWDKIVEKFQGYAFNKSHAIFYSFLGYQSAYLKAHFPLEFMTANLMFEVNSGAKISEDNIAKIKDEIRGWDVTILPPDVNKSDTTYKIIDEKTLMTGLDALKFMGKDAIPEILNKRPFNSFEDFLSRVEGRKVSARSIQALAASGGLDSFGISRKRMFLYASDYKKKLQVWVKRNPETDVREFEYPWPDDVGEWTVPEKYAMEHYYIGEGLCCGIREAYPGFFNSRALDFSKLPELFPEDEESNDRYEITASDGIVEGVIRNYFEFKVKKEDSKIFGEIMAKVDLEDPYGNVVAMTIFPSGLEKFNNRIKLLGSKNMTLEPGIAVHCAASANWYENNLSLIFSDLKRVAPIPPKPSDLKARKVSMRVVGKRKRKKVSKIDREKLLETIEDELIEEGHADI